MILGIKFDLKIFNKIKYNKKLFNMYVSQI